MRTAGLASIVVFATALAACEDVAPEPSIYEDVPRLGEALFSDTNLSRNRTQSCATCHDPDRAFTDSRVDDAGLVRAVSLGDDGVSLGTRNAPSAAYAALSPEFHFGPRERHNKQNGNRNYDGALGGQFWDGRAAHLQAQAGGPPLNPVEMAMADKSAVVARVLEDEEYERAFRQFFGSAVFDSDDDAYAAMTESIAAFERTEALSSFDSRYDRSLRGEVQLSFLELTGKAVFFSQFANCSICHQLYSEGDPINEVVEPFTGFEFHNIGVPANVEVQALSGVTAPDVGLLGNPVNVDPEARGKFKVPTLRNVAVTGPYMHNGVFRDLKTVVEFYDRHNNPDVRITNPETGLPWRAAEIEETVSIDLLEVGDPLEDIEIDGLVCFMRALTDARYEPLIDDDGLDCTR